MNACRQERDDPGVRAAEDAAADWLARRHAGLAPAEEAELRSWLAKAPENAAAFARLDRTWAKLTEPRRRGRAATILRELDRRDAGRTKRRNFASFAIAAVAVALLVLPALRVVHDASAPATVTLRPNLRTLPDGSTVELNAQAEVEVHFSAAERRVVLLSGEALFDVRREVERPFVVVAAEVAVRAVGTAFSVRHDDAGVNVLVTSGRVAIERQITAAPASPLDQAGVPVLVDAGCRVSLPATPKPVELPAPRVVTPAELSAALAWRNKRVEFSGTPLSEAVELFNRQNRVQLSVSDSRTAARRITGIYWTDDPEGFARVLSIGMNLGLEQSNDRIVLREQ